MSLRLVAAAFATLAVVANVTDRQSYSVSLAGNRSVSVHITVGSVRVHGETRADARIEVTRTAPSKEALARIPVRMEESQSAVDVRGEQLDGGTDASLKTDVTLRVPHDASLRDLRVMEGRIELTNLRGTVTADIRRGPISASNLSGTVRLETGIGDITATNARLTPGGLLRLRAFNGDIRLVLAARPTDARVMALALNGTIESDVELTHRDTWGPRWAEATLGKGEPVISLDVITGVIRIEAPAR